LLVLVVLLSMSADEVLLLLLCWREVAISNKRPIGQWLYTNTKRN
jgi:hypothetical protein